MKSHPGSAIPHIGFKSFALGRIIRSGIQEDHNLVFRKKFSIQVIPVISGVIGKMMSHTHFWKPPVGFVHETDMRLVGPAGVKSNHTKILSFCLSHGCKALKAEYANTHERYELSSGFHFRSI
jgi:hypothetical protein